MRAGRTGTLKARALRLNVTETERHLWSRLRGGQLGHSFRRQHPIPPYIVDFACIAAHLIVEADGGHHNLAGEHDRRDRYIERKGWRILRFWNNDIRENLDGVMQTIAEALRAAPPPQPSPARGGGRDPRFPREGGG